MLPNIPDWESSKQRFAALWERKEADRSTVFIKVLKDPAQPLVYPDCPPDEIFARSITDETFMYENIRQCIDKLYYAGDAFPMINMYLGTGGHCGFTKNYRYTITDNSLWFDPVIEDIENDRIAFDPDSELLQTVRRIIAYMKPRSRGDFFLSNTDNCSSLDALASLRGSAELLLDMLESPEAVHEQLAVLQDILHRTEDEFQPELMAMDDGGTCTEWMGLWCPGRHHQLQCDLSVMISPDMFAEFAMPELEENAAKFGRTVYHLDGQEQIRHLDMILSIPGIDLIQWTPVAGQPETSTFVEVLKRIQKAGKGLVLMPHIRELPKLLDELDPVGVHYIPHGINTRQEADEAVALIAKRGARRH